MGVVSSRPTAGQASLEYVAALALIAALFVVAAPAVGAPDIPRLVVAKLRLGICLVANDVCSDAGGEGGGAGSVPDAVGPQGPRGVGHRVHASRSATAGRSPSRRSRTAASPSSAPRAASGGLTGWRRRRSRLLGPVAFDARCSAARRARVQAARGWQFPDQATAERFLEHALAQRHQRVRRLPGGVELGRGRRARSRAIGGLVAGGQGLSRARPARRRLGGLGRRRRSARGSRAGAS